jgi:hypothetical protein
MSFLFDLPEGDFRFYMPDTVGTTTHQPKEEIMSARTESGTRSKGNGKARPSVGAVGPEAVSGDVSCPREQMIAEAAYFRAEQRGFAPGNEMADWLQAEADVEAVFSPRH